MISWNPARFAFSPFAVVVAILLGTGAPARAEGVLELSHACATATGCVPGDAPGYPITLDGESGRSYRLTSDLRVPISTHGIVIGASGTSIDLNGFTIAQACTWQSPAGGGVPICTRTGEGDGIRTTSNVAIEAVRVRNGSIHFMGGMGIFLGRESHVEDVSVRESGTNGIYVGPHSVVSNCQLEDNGNWGVFGGGVLESSTVSGSFTGVSWFGVLSGNSVTGNDDTGIQAQTGANVFGNRVSDNGRAGISCNRDCRIAENSVHSTGTNSNDYGIECRGGCNVVDNMIHESGGFGIKFWDPEGSYRGNTISDSGVASVDGGLNLGGNACDGALCP